MPSTADRRPFGKYLLLRELGRGGMGVVWLARDVSLKREVALKTLTDPEAGPGEIERLRREAQAVAQLRHPNIVQVYEVGFEAGRAYFTMEFVRGLSLDRAAPTLDLRRKVEIVRDLAAALHFAHLHGVIHRDVKPSNVLVAEDGRAVLTDFGLARNQRDPKNLTVAGTIMGTPNFMAPEQVDGDPERIGGRTDVFALGSVLYLLLCGKMPFERPEPIATLHAVLTADPPPPDGVKPGVPRELSTVCLKALEKSPDERYETAEAFSSDLDRWLSGTAVLARPHSGPERALRWVRRNRLAAALAGALAIAVGVGSWAVLRGRADEPRQADPAWEEARARREQARGHLEAGVRQMDIADKCMMTGRGDDLRKALAEAEAQYGRALELDPGNAAALAGRGRARRLAGDREGAVIDLDAAIAADPGAGAAWYERGLVRLSWFQEARDAIPGSGGGSAAEAARDHQFAAAEDLKSAAAAPAEPGQEWRPLHARAALAFLAADFPAARRDLDAALEKNPFLDDALVLRATIRLLESPADAVGACTDLDRAVQANALSAAARNLRGIARTRAGDSAGALADHDAAVRLDPRFAPALLNRGRLHLRAGATAAGLADLRSFLETFPGHPRAPEVRAELARVEER